METACNYVFFDEVFSLKWKNLETSHVRKVEKCKELRQGYFPLFFLVPLLLLYLFLAINTCFCIFFSLI